MAPIETKVVNGVVTRVKADHVPCKGGPLEYLNVHRPYDTTIPLSDGKYRLNEQGGQAVYIYEPDGRGRIGARAEQ